LRRRRWTARGGPRGTTCGEVDCGEREGKGKERGEGGRERKTRRERVREKKRKGQRERGIED
jgi:hypothetical protein